jgi:rhodanese-related sulfurtransferase
MPNGSFHAFPKATKTLAILFMAIGVIFWCGGKAIALPGAVSPVGSPPGGVLAATATMAPLTESADELETTLAQFLQGIPPGFYGLRDVNGLKTRLKETDLVLIDVREVSEYSAGHIDGAINIPLRTLVQNLGQVPNDKPVMLYCSSGYRTGMGVMTLRLLGYDNVEGFPPSYQGWQKAEG